MSWLITLIIGAVIGWLVGLVSVSIRRAGIYTNILIGIIGSIVGFWFFVDVMKLGINNTSIGFFSTTGLIWEIIGAIVVLVVLNIVSYSEFESPEEHSYSRGVAHEHKEDWKRKNRD